MGFVRANVLPILKEHRLRPFTGHALCLGQADVYFTESALRKMAQTAGVALKAGNLVTYSHRADFAAKGYLSRDTLFTSLGFSLVSALDASGFEGAEILFDLNAPELPAALVGLFDAVFDHGTMEHVFDVRRCLSHIHGLLKAGGRVIHSSPSSNYLDHGFYMFSPTLFHDFYEVNGWVIRSLQVARVHPGQQEIEAPFFADYEPGLFDHTSAGGLDGNAAYATICIAEKTESSRGDLVPHQGFYRRTAGWEPESNPFDLRKLLLAPPFVHVGGRCWMADLASLGVEEGDSALEPARSQLHLFEGDAPLGPAHALHEQIQTVGGGCYSHWHYVLYFSTADHTDPNTNGHAYRVLVRTSQ